MIAGDNCIGRLGTLPARAGSLTALVRFTDANAGDAIAVTMSGPGGTLAGGPFRLQGGGDGYYYSTFPVGGLPNGEYTLIATRNGNEVASTSSGAAAEAQPPPEDSLTAPRCAIRSPPASAPSRGQGADRLQDAR